MMSGRKPRQGYTLVELLVAMVLSGLAIGFAFMLLQGSRGGFMRVSSSVQLQAETREAVRMIEHDLRNTGLKIANMYSSRILSTVNCPHAYVDPTTGDSASFSFINRNDWTYPGDEVVFAQYMPDGNGNVNCAPTSLQVVRYRLRTLDSVLVRAQAATFAGITTATEIPVCHSVVAFQMEYALLGLDSTLMDSTAAWYSPASFPIVPSGHRWTVGPWSSTALSGAATVDYVNIKRGYGYRIEIQLSPDAAFADTIAGAQRILVGLLDGSQLVDTIPAWVGPNTGRKVVVDIEATQDIPSARIVIGARMGAANTSSKLTFSQFRFSLKRLTNYVWLSDPTPAQRRRVQALRLSIITRTEREVRGNAPWTFEGVGDLPGLNLIGSDARKGYAFFQRIIPVVNHGQ